MSAARWLRGRVPATVLAALPIALVACGPSLASADAAAPAWRLLGVTGPTHLPPRQSEVQRVTIAATDGTYALAQATGRGTGMLGSASAQVTGFATESGSFHAGDAIEGTGIPAGTTVVAAAGGTLTLSQPPTASGEEALTVVETTAPLPFDAPASGPGSVEEALTSLSALAGSVTVSGGPGDSSGSSPYFVRFSGSLGDTDVAPLAADGAALGGEHAYAETATVGPGGAGKGEIAIFASNVGGAPTAGRVSVTLGPLPAGSITSEAGTGTGWTCPGGPGETTVTCTTEEPVPAASPAPALSVPVEVNMTSAASLATTASVSGGGAESFSIPVPIEVSAVPAGPGVQAFMAGAFDADGKPSTQAGGHPAFAITNFFVNTVLSPRGTIVPSGDARDIRVDLPPGFLGNPLVTPRCPQRLPSSKQPGADACPVAASVGHFYMALLSFGDISTGDVAFPTYNDVPPEGFAAEFTTVIGGPQQTLLGSVRSDGDYGVTITAPTIANYEQVFGSFVALEGNPAGAAGKAFLTNPADCSGEAASTPLTTIGLDTWQQPSLLGIASAAVPPVVGCDRLEFRPTLSFQPASGEAAAPTAATAELDLDQSRLSDPQALAPPPLKRAVVALPEGLALNPAAADGLAACTEAQIGFRGSGFAAPNPMRFDTSHPTCPDGSKLGTVEVRSPLLEAPLEGTIYLAAQEANPFGSLLAIYLVVDDPRTGLVLKLPGEVRTDAATGQLTAVFDNGPQLPFESLKLSFRGGGPHSPLATPDVCGTYATSGVLTPWSAPESGPPAQTKDSFRISSGAGGGACPSSPAARRFAPGFVAGTTSGHAGRYSPLVIAVSRGDGEQQLSRLEFGLPEGLLGKLAGLAYCPDGAILAAATSSGSSELASPSCPAASEIGRVDSSAGIGAEPIHVAGHLYLAGPYEGAPLSAVVITPAVAGPFDLGDVVVRAPLFVDPTSAKLTVRSDPIPTLLRGIPLQLRSVRIDVDRPGFTLTPTSCAPMAVTASISGDSGAVATPANRFRVEGCKGLPFKPRLSVHLRGPVRRAKDPGLRAVLRQPPGQANIGRVSVVLPRSEFIDQRHIDAPCTRVQFRASACPPGSILGYARAFSPLLDRPLEGPVYLRSNGGERELPDLVADLHGQIHVELVGFIDSVHRKGIEASRIRNTFVSVPDAPVSRFVLELQGGDKGILQNSTNICHGRQRALVRMQGQNGKTHDFATPVRADCGKKSQARSGR
jgi:hypothetical protein